MNLPLSPYCSTDAVRAAIGVTDNELTDEMLIEQNLGAELEVDLRTWLPTYATIYTQGAAAGATEEQRLKTTLLRLYAQWFLAAQAANTMALAIPQLIGDGKSEMRRFLDFDFDALQAKAMAKAGTYRGQLEELQGAQAASSGASVLSVSRPDYDPVTHQ